MSTWILVVIMYGGYYTTTPAITTQEFNSKETCMTAAAFLKTRVIPDKSTTWVSFSCVEK